MHSMPENLEYRLCERLLKLKLSNNVY